MDLLNLWCHGHSQFGGSMDLRMTSDQSKRGRSQPGVVAPSSRRSSGGAALNALETRIGELEHVASSQARELRIQFERIAQLQAEYDILRIRSIKP
jgi:hypothetical protein